MVSVRMFILLSIAALAASCGKPAAACTLPKATAVASPDASTALMDCIAATAAGGRIELAPGTYALRQRIILTKPVTISTAGLAASAPGCAALPAGSCAILSIDPQATAQPNQTPIEIAAAGITLSHLIVQGGGAQPRIRALCSAPDSRPLGGGIRVSASGFALRKSVLRNFTCHTALEVVVGSKSALIDENLIGPNGDHRPGEIWSDGVTIHDSEATVVRGNMFIDNTDVQLILGGCRRCSIENNRFRHSGAADKASFAELMLHSWPTTSGDYSGTLVRGNIIDCGPYRRCGYGIMVGSAPWYEGRASGGTITGNRVSNAMIAINVDALTGPVEFSANAVQSSGGRSPSDCGVRDWPAVNVGETSRALVRGDPSDQTEDSVSTRGCLLNREAR